MQKPLPLILILGTLSETQSPPCMSISYHKLHSRAETPMKKPNLSLLQNHPCSVLYLLQPALKSAGKSTRHMWNRRALPQAALPGGFPQTLLCSPNPTVFPKPFVPMPFLHNFRQQYPRGQRCSDSAQKGPQNPELFFYKNLAHGEGQCNPV